MKHLEQRHLVSNDIQEDILNIPNIQELMQRLLRLSAQCQITISFYDS